MALVHNDHMIEQIAAAVADESFRNSILPGASNRNSNRAHAQTLRGFQNLSLERVLAIEDEKLRGGVVGESLTELLRYPCTRGVSSDIAVKNAATVMCYHEKAIENAERDRRNGEEIHRCNRFSMIVQKSRPSPRWLRIARSLPHPALNRALGNLKPEHLQLAMNPRRAPGAIFGHHAKN